MQRREACLYLAVAILLEGCGTQLTQPPSVTESDLSSTVAPNSSIIIGREFSNPNAYLGPLPTLTVVMKPYDIARNMATCDAFMTLPPFSTLPASTPSWDILPIRWPTYKPIENGSAQACNDIVSAYDFFAAARLLEQVRSTATDSNGKRVDISGAGPFVIEQYATGSGIGFIVIDMSPLKADTETSLNSEFKVLVGQLGKNIALQEAQISPSTVGAASSNVANPGSATAVTVLPSVSGTVGGWWDKICSAVDSQLGQLLLAVFGKVPLTSVVVSWVDTIDKAGCAKSGQGASGVGVASSPDAGKSKKK